MNSLPTAIGRLRLEPESEDNRPRDGLRQVEALLPDLDEVPVDGIPQTLIRLGHLQVRIAALESSLVARALAARNGIDTDDRQERLLSVQEVAKLLGMSASWIYKHWRRRLSFGIREGGRVVFPASEVRRYMRRGRPSPEGREPQGVQVGHFG